MLTSHSSKKLLGLLSTIFLLIIYRWSGIWVEVSKILLKKDRIYLIILMLAQNCFTRIDNRIFRILAIFCQMWFTFHYLKSNNELFRSLNKQTYIIYICRIWEFEQPLASAHILCLYQSYQLHVLKEILRMLLVDLSTRR